MILEANFSNTRRTIPKKMILGNATQNPNLIIPPSLDYFLVADVHDSLDIASNEALQLP